jgi:hypothetical protein
MPESFIIQRALTRLLPKRAKKIVALATNRLLGQPQKESPEVLLQRLSASVRGAWSEWQSTLSHVHETRAITDLDALRIAATNLRYRIELLFDLGHRDLKTKLMWLATSHARGCG